MFNFEHEIDDIPDLKFRCFLVSDFFHDSIVRDIHFDPETGTATLNLKADRDLPLGEKVGRDLRNCRIQFIDCVYWEQSFLYPGGWEYLNGRFKDSVLLRNFQGHDGKRYYHLRIQLSCEGYIDLVFHRFDIIADSEIVLPNGTWEWTRFEYLKRFENMSIAAIESIAAGKDLFEAPRALHFLCSKHDPSALNRIREMVKTEEPNHWTRAVYLLGMYGEFSDLPLLAEIKNRAEQKIMKKHVQDAIDRLLARINR